MLWRRTALSCFYNVLDSANEVNTFQKTVVTSADIVYSQD